MVLFGEVLDGAEAERAGLVWRCVDDDDAAAARRRAGRPGRGRAPRSWSRRVKATIGRHGLRSTAHDEAVERELERPGLVARPARVRRAAGGPAAQDLQLQLTAWIPLSSMHSWSSCGSAPQLAAEARAEAVLTLAEHRDRRVIAPLIDLIASVRGPTSSPCGPPGWMADPALHPALVQLAATRLGDLGDAGYWEQVDRAIGRCRPGAAEEAEEIEVTLLAATQASLLDAGAAEMEVGLDGEYPATEVVLRLGDRERRHAIWNFDEANPDDPTTLDRAFALYRIANLASWG